MGYGSCAQSRSQHSHTILSIATIMILYLCNTVGSYLPGNGLMVINCCILTDSCVLPTLNIYLETVI